ncbi:hypothetical protein BaRGS_00032347 [Batillaria attramentaria]|uniref:VPS37 C-terminal domain-containing protein n=1 Tax=Batillaria attramentaria TaxID=370345 RepID=A0ABD0JN98_9CAEN
MSRMNESEAVALLQHLSKEDLQHLLNDDSKLNDLVQDLSQVRSLQSEHDNLVAQNKSLAEYNLSLQPRLDTLKTQVATDYERANTLKGELGMNKARLDTFVGDQKLDTIHALLQTEAATAEEESELLADSFCEKNMSVEEFLAQYLPKRMLAHKRRIKAEKMGELLRGSHGPMSPPAWPSSAPTGSSFTATPAPYPPGPPSVPYPVGGMGSSYGGSFGMPDPSLYRR